MKKVTLSKDLAVKMYQGKDQQLKEFALENYPELGLKITDRIKTFEDACNELGISSDIPNFNLPNAELEDFIKAKYMIATIVKTLNEGWTPNWKDSNESKYYPWFKMSSSGVGFSYLDYDYDFTVTFVGSRLVFKSSELAEYAGKQFEEIYKKAFEI